MDIRYVIMNVLRTSKTSATTLYISFHRSLSPSSCHITEMSLSVNSTRAKVVCFVIDRR